MRLQNVKRFIDKAIGVVKEEMAFAIKLFIALILAAIAIVFYTPLILIAVVCVFLFGVVKLIIGSE